MGIEIEAPSGPPPGMSGGNRGAMGINGCPPGGGGGGYGLSAGRGGRGVGKRISLSDFSYLRRNL
ncbi:MAG: hypothetical protein U9R60_04355 [Bacteroidota bacterium]|nr:hypothetical protein [Bacteroidota bacterium]